MKNKLKLLLVSYFILFGSATFGQNIDKQLVGKWVSTSDPEQFMVLNNDGTCEVSYSTDLKLKWEADGSKYRIMLLPPGSDKYQNFGEECPYEIKEIDGKTYMIVTINAIEGGKLKYLKEWGSDIRYVERVWPGWKEIVGKWKWFNGSVHDFGGNGIINGNSAHTWKISDAAKKEILVSWTKYLDI